MKNKIDNTNAENTDKKLIISGVIGSDGHMDNVYTKDSFNKAINDLLCSAKLRGIIKDYYINENGIKTINDIQIISFDICS